MPLKIIKVLVQELSSATDGGPISGFDTLSPADLSTAAATAAASEANNNEDLDDGADGDDDDWEDIPGGGSTLDLAGSMTKQQLMSFGNNFGAGNGTGSIISNRQRDDETQAYLMEFFRDVSGRNIGGFAELYAALTQDERDKLAIIG